MVDEKGRISGMKESAQVQRWHDRISVSKKWMDKVASDNNWENILDELKNKYDVVLGNTQIPPHPEVFSYKDAMLANLYYKDPYVAVNAKRDASIQGAYLLEAGVNHLWRELKLKRDIELQITDALCVGHAWNKVGNNTKTSGSGDQLKIIEDSIYANRVSWRDMRMNVGCKQPPKDNLWIAQRIYRPTEDLKKDYGKIASKISGSPHPSLDEKFKQNILYREDFNYTAIYEIHDARERKIYLIADGVTDKYLEDPRPWPDYLDEYPYQLLSFHEIPDEPYPQSDVGQWDALVKEKIKIFTMMLNHVKRWNRQLVIKKNIMTPQELDKFEKGIDGTILQASIAGTVDIQAAFKTLDFGPLPPDIYMILDRLDAAIRKASGLAEMAYGGVTKTGSRTADELNMIKAGQDARSERKQDRIENHCANIARHLIIQMKANFDVPYIANVTGKEPKEIIQAFQDQGLYDPKSKTIKFDKTMIKGEYDVTVKAGSTLPLDKGSRDAVLQKVFQMSIPLASAPTLPPFIAEVVKEILKDYEIRSLSQAFDQQIGNEGQVQQAEQQRAEQQDNKVAAETEKRSAQAKQIQVDTVLKTAQAMGKASGTMHPDLEIAK